MRYGIPLSVLSVELKNNNFLSRRWNSIAPNALCFNHTFCNDGVILKTSYEGARL